MFDTNLTTGFSRLLVLAAIFAGVVLISLGIAFWSSGRLAVRRRLAGGGETRTAAAPEKTLRVDSSHGAWVRLINAIERSGVSLVDTKSA